MAAAAWRRITPGRDARVRAIHRENGGLSAARNTGTLAAKGDYITYVDGDDFLHPVCVESLYGLIERYRADLAVCTMKTFQEKPDEVIRQTTGQTACFEREKALEHMLYQRLFDTSACGKLYRTEDARGQLFPVGRLFEDLATVYRFLWRAERASMGERRALRLSHAWGQHHESALPRGALR